MGVVCKLTSSRKSQKNVHKWGGVAYKWGGCCLHKTQKFYGSSSTTFSRDLNTPNSLEHSFPAYIVQCHICASNT